jgi:hypothetical protein
MADSETGASLTDGEAKVLRGAEALFERLRILSYCRPDADPTAAALKALSREIEEAVHRFRHPETTP